MGITRQQALDCFASDDLIGIGMEADAVRRRIHPEGVVSYTMACEIDYIRAFGGDGIRDASANSSQTGSEGTLSTIEENVADAVASGATALVLRSDLRHEPRQHLSLEALEALLRAIRKRFPQVWPYCLSAPEILFIADANSLDLSSVLGRLQDAGLGSIPGQGIEPPAANRQGSCSLDDWLRVHRTAHELGIGTTAGMIFGAGETIEERVNQLAAIRQLQDETGGFTAFTPWSWRRGASALAGQPADEPTSVEYLKALAVSRMFLDNIDNVQGAWDAQGLKVLQMGLRFGANDAGAVALPAASGKPTGGGKLLTEEELRRVIRDAGFRPVQRDTLYRMLFLN